MPNLRESPKPTWGCPWLMTKAAAVLTVAALIWKALA